MNTNERRLNGRDVLAKTFPAKTKRGYDPIDVDAYLELVASQVDLLHGDIARAGEGQAASPADVSPAVAPAAGAAVGAAAAGNSDTLSADEHQALIADLEAARSERDALQVRLDEELASGETLRAENQQLRTQLTSVAPPPPGSEVAPPPPPEVVEAEAVVVDAVVEPAPVSAAMVAAPAQEVAVVDERAAEESYDLVLRAARRSAEEAISEAHVRADEIVADANLTASRIAQESDRKAYEAANRAQGELSQINAEIESQQTVLSQVSTAAEERRNELRRLGETIITWANQEAEELVDLRATTVASAEDAASANDTRA